MALQNEKNSRYLLRDWKPENPAFWENKGKHIARRNLWISVSCLLSVSSFQKPNKGALLGLMAD
ncbi:hypothetical protein GUK16_18480 [Escherichia coli]|nr:hypothetical protein [Escherichia coli]